MKYTIGFRRAEKEDIDFLLTLRKKSMIKHFIASGIKMSEEQHLELINENFYLSNVILYDRKPIGLLKMGVAEVDNMPSRSLHISQIQILPKYQGKGIGSSVLKVVKKRALYLNLPITLNVLLKNPARALYLRHGFQIKSKNRLEFLMVCPLEVFAT